MKFGKLSKKNASQDTYYCRITKSNGNRTWKSTGTNKFAEACRVKRNWERNEALCPTCEEGGLFKRIDEFLASKKHKSPEYKRVLNVYTKSWREFFGDCRLDEITPKQVEEYLCRERARTKPSPRTLNNERGYLSIFFKWAMQRQYCRWNPALCVEKRPETKKKVRALSECEVRMLMEAAEELALDQAWLFIMIAVETGLRRGTIGKLTNGMIDQESWILTVPAEYMKSREEFRAPLSERCRGMLHSVITEGPPSAPICGPLSNNDWKRITRHCGLDVTPHDCRRTFLTRLRRAGVAMEVAMRLSDHHDIKTVLESYRAVEDEDMRKALEQL
jgi:integrase